MESSGVGFGTSGARGLVSAMTDRVCYAYTRGFLQHIAAGPSQPREIAVAGDLRSSTGRIMEAVWRAAEDQGYRVVHCGRIPSPAVALFGLAHQMPSIMVTGSHIPDDRNGIKFNKATGEILKDDEIGIAGQAVEIDESLFDAAGAFRRPIAATPPESPQAAEEYVARYLEFIDSKALQPMRIGVYQHSAVGRDLLMRVLEGLGAETVALGRSETFMPVDTEAIRPEDVELARGWARSTRFDAIVSTDGDSDRPLVSDEWGGWLRGDVLGILCAKQLGADVVCTPVSSNTAAERSAWFREVRRTRIGSPHVIAEMMRASAAGAACVVGYEANGGFLLNSDLERDGRRLRALPTRDAFLGILGVLLLARAMRSRISRILDLLPARFTASNRLKDFPVDRSAWILGCFDKGSDRADGQALEEVFGELAGRVAKIDRTDGLRVTFATGEIIHLRPSGNAPEFRCYSEADTVRRAEALNAETLRIVTALAREAHG
ncbi:MAG TPA: phosphomannomutase [Candidatus Paceibacterota bacterium]|nr:phosphomannomutase [Verrucomicrobiota bacterium]HRZ45215.1 phosphomannomutase [Candidatus Paceibacterota bacterium]